ncbi:hypothetical protein PVAG01_10187 [Phlyctema vagabunda]|uniref:Uncharacterized protein n=1 Tax=Phlyctema vagabunda TaxID=108571 RepID=A0ABR4P586_9HELO
MTSPSQDLGQAQPAPHRRGRVTIDNTHAEYQGIFDSAHEYQAFKDRRKLDTSHVRYDECPKTDSEKKYFVKILFEAIRNTTDVKDKLMANGKPGTAVQRMKDGYWPDMFVEEVCWDIIESINKSHCGAELLDSHLGKQAENFGSYDEHFDAIANVCRVHKSTCKNLLDASFINRLVTCPTAEAKSKDANSKINDKRNVQNRLGREAAKRGLKLDALRALLVHDDADDSSSARKRKRKRSAARSPENLLEYPESEQYMPSPVQDASTFLESEQYMPNLGQHAFTVPESEQYVPIPVQDAFEFPEDGERFDDMAAF